MEPTTPATKAIYPSLGKAMRAVKAVEKDRKNDHQGYKFRGIDEVYNELHDALAANDIIMRPDVLKRLERELRSSQGKTQIHVRMKVRYFFVSCVDGSEALAGEVWSEALDTSDKATNKCLSFAQKYVLLQSFLVPTRDNIPEDDDKEGDRVTIERGERDRGDDRRRDDRPRERNEQRPQRARDAWSRLEGANDTPPLEQHPPAEQRELSSAKLPNDDETRIPADICERVRDLSPVPWSEQTNEQLLDQEQKLRTYSQGAKDPIFRARLAILATFCERERQARSQQRSAGGAA